MQVPTLTPTVPPAEAWVVGLTLWERLRLDRALDDGLTGWIATDLRTGCRHFLEWHPLTPELAGRFESYPEATAAAHPNLLPFYRHEVLENGVVVIAGYHPLLEREPFSPAQLAADLPFTVTALGGVGLALAELHERGLRPHGGVVPARIRAHPEFGVVLTGYPQAGDFIPDRGSGAAPPSIADDVFGLAAVAFHWLTGGVRPTPSAPGRRIDDIRRENGLPPTGWPAGWDEAILAALGPPAQRPAQVDDLLQTWEVLTGGDCLSLRAQRRLLAPPGEPAPTRRVPSWRQHALRRASRTGSAEPVTRPTAEAPVYVLAQIIEERRELARERDELIERQRTLATEQLELERHRVAQDERARQLDTATAELDLHRQTLAREQDELAHAQEALDRQSRQLESVQAALDTRTHALERTAQELSAREESLLAVQHSARELLGLSDARELGDFVRQLADQRAELQKAQERLSQEQARLASFAPAPPAAAEAEHGPAAGAVESPAAEAGAGGAASGGTAPAVPGPGAASAEPHPPSLAPLPPLPKVVLSIGARRLHVVSGPWVRFGRHAGSDVLLLALTGESSQPGLAINREISRKHFELQVSETGVWVLDGWSDERKPSQHGVCVDGRRVPETGATLRSGALLSVTTRAPSRLIPHWRVMVSHAPARKAPAAAAALPSAVLLRRLDEWPDDVLILLDSIPLRRLGLDHLADENAALTRQPDTFAWMLDGRTIPVSTSPAPVPNVSVLPPDDPLGLGSPPASANLP